MLIKVNLEYIKGIKLAKIEGTAEVNFKGEFLLKSLVKSIILSKFSQLKKVGFRGVVVIDNEKYKI